MNERKRERETNIIGNKNEHSLQKFSEKKGLYEIGRKIERDRKNKYVKIVLSLVSTLCYLKLVYIF